MTGGNHDSPIVQVALGDARLPSCFVDGDGKGRFRNVPVSHGWDNETRKVKSHTARLGAGHIWYIAPQPKGLFSFVKEPQPGSCGAAFMEGADCR